MQEVIKTKLYPRELTSLCEFGAKIDHFGVNLAVFNSHGELSLWCKSGKFESDIETLKGAALKALEGYREKLLPNGCVMRFPEFGGIITALLISASNQEDFAAVMDLGSVRDFQADNGGGSIRAEDVFEEMFLQVAQKFNVASKSQSSVEKVSVELSQVYEELSLLYKLSSHMTVSENEAGFLQRSCDGLADIVLVEGIAVFQEKVFGEQKKLILAAGSGLMDISEHETMVLKARLADEVNQGKDALLDSDVDRPFKYEWSVGIKNILAVPIYGKRDAHSGIFEQDCEGKEIAGILVGINRINKADFDSPDVKLFNSVANSCAVFMENSRLFDDLKEMFVGSLKSLASAIDAKDHYTRGHSERVAIISKWIAQQMPQLTESDVHRVYLAGLLHDIGKLGISDSILGKNGKLDDEQFAHLKTHPAVGAKILGGMKQMRDIIPGILCHHEKIDGTGYPNALKGKDIPLIGKIISIADSFDAMTSDRPYRKALLIEEALQEIRRGLGTQFDEEAAMAFLNSDIGDLCDVIKGETLTEYSLSSFSKYSSKAAGGLIK